MKNDGGPAFPCKTYPHEGCTVEVTGMSLRDYYIGQAVMAVTFQQFAVAMVKAMAPDGQRITMRVSPQDTARAAVELADAMLAARKEAEGE